MWHTCLIGLRKCVHRIEESPKTTKEVKVKEASSRLRARANAERNFQMAEAKWPVCKEEAKANVHRPWPCASDTADRPLRPGRLPSTSERIAWERAGAARGLWLCCVGRSSPMGIDLPPRLARDPSALPPFRKFISAFALTRFGGYSNVGVGPLRLLSVTLGMPFFHPVPLMNRKKNPFRAVRARACCSLGFGCRTLDQLRALRREYAGRVCLPRVGQREEKVRDHFA